MDFSLSQDQQMLVAAIEQLCSGFDDEYWLTCDRTGEYPEAFYQRLAKAGWLGWPCRRNMAAQGWVLPKPR